MIFYALYQMGVMFKGGYVFNIFCHEFYIEGVQLLSYTVAADNVQALVALVGGVPLAAGMLFAWPVANKMGKRNFMILGCVLSVIGSVICLLSPGNIWILLIGQVVKGLSSIPGAYIMMALFADVLDHLEALWLPRGRCVHVGLQHDPHRGQRTCNRIFQPFLRRGRLCRPFGGEILFPRL